MALVINIQQTLFYLKYSFQMFQNIDDILFMKIVGSRKRSCLATLINFSLFGFLFKKGKHNSRKPQLRKGNSMKNDGRVLVK